MKPKLLISFSGGRTSAFMTYLLLKHHKKEFDMIVVFANTGREREETLEFVNQCDLNFNFKTIWVESVVHAGRKGSTHKIVTFKTASREGEPFEEVIKKYGIPNVDFLHCTRELKTNPIHSYVRSVWPNTKYFTAIGIRMDEADRISKDAKKKRFVYPLVNSISKGDVNKFWMKQKFDLSLKSYEGNCKDCFKKTLRKLLTINKERIEAGKVDDWGKRMETKYENFIPPTQKAGRTVPIRFNRKNLSYIQIEQLSQKPFQEARDESFDTYTETLKFGDELHPLDLSNGCVESCEPFQ